MNLKQITDKDLIVFLVATGHEIVRTEKDPDRNRSFVYFDDTVVLNQSILDYTNKKATRLSCC